MSTEHTIHRVLFLCCLLPNTGVCPINIQDPTQLTRLTTEMQPLLEKQMREIVCRPQSVTIDFQNRRQNLRFKISKTSEKCLLKATVIPDVQQTVKMHNWFITIDLKEAHFHIRIVLNQKPSNTLKISQLSNQKLTYETTSILTVQCIPPIVNFLHTTPILKKLRQFGKC